MAMAKSRGGVCDARCQQWARECSQKEERLKTLWFIKNKQRIYENLGKDREKLEHRAKKLMEKKKAKFTKLAEAEKPVKEFPSWRPLKDADADLMRPIKPAIKNILYVPKDQSFFSKQKYLEARYKEKPEDRYYYPYCSSWIFGWRLKDYPYYSVSQWGRRDIIHSSFYRRNASSLQHDPDWYRICQTGDPETWLEDACILHV